MKTLRIALLSALCAVTFSSCGTISPGPSIAQFAAGSDAAYLNATRGRPEAQITAQQARQFDRQRQQVAAEMELEQMKHQKTMQTLQTVGAVVRIFAGVALR